MKRLIIGTAGHIDHGKSALVKALTGTDPDRLKEEKERGITIELGFASLSLPSGRKAGIVDVPGHEKFVRNMVAGATGIDLLLLVIAADEGIMPQTREHMDICGLLGIDSGIVALTKIDKVDEDWLHMVEEDVSSYLEGTFLKGAPIVKVSPMTGEGLSNLVEIIDGTSEHLVNKSSDRPLKFPIDRVFTLKGIGTVVTGTLVSGSFNKGEDLLILPKGVRGKVRYIESHGLRISQAEPGSRTAANLSGVPKNQVKRGDVISRENEGITTRQIDALVTNLPVNPDPLKFGARVNLHYGTTHVEAVLQPYGRKEIPPGEKGMARIYLLSPGVLTGKVHFILRGYSRLKNFGYTVGGGVIVNPLSPRRRPGKMAEPPDTLSSLLAGDSLEQLLAVAGEFPLEYIDEKFAAIVTGLTFTQVSEGIRVLTEEGEFYRTVQGKSILWRTLDKACRDLHSALTGLAEREGARNGFSLAEARARIEKSVPEDLANHAMKILLDHGTVVLTGEGYLPASAKKERVHLKEIFEEEILNVIREKGFTGPTVKEVAGEAGTPEKEAGQILARLVRSGIIYRSRDYYFSKEAVADLEGKLVTFLQEKEKITISEFKEISGTTRKYSVPLMELMDQKKVTIRKGDYRVLWEK